MKDKVLLKLTKQEVEHVISLIKGDIGHIQYETESFLRAMSEHLKEPQRFVDRINDHTMFSLELIDKLVSERSVSVLHEKANRLGMNLLARLALIQSEDPASLETLKLSETELGLLGSLIFTEEGEFVDYNYGRLNQVKEEE